MIFSLHAICTFTARCNRIFHTGGNLKPFRTILFASSSVYSMCLVSGLSNYLLFSLCSGTAQIPPALSWESSAATQHWNRPTAPARRSWSAFIQIFQPEASSFSTSTVTLHTRLVIVLCIIHHIDIHLGIVVVLVKPVNRRWDQRPFNNRKVLWLYARALSFSSLALFHYSLHYHTILKSKQVHISE